MCLCMCVFNIRMYVINAYMCVCIYVCMSLSKYVCVYVCMYVCMSLMYVCI